MITWPQDAIFYHIYPLGMVGAPRHNTLTDAPVPRLAEVADWIPHMRSLGVTALYLGPLFESSVHGYDTADYYHVDRRLGDRGTLAALVRTLHDNGIKVILDGVFHHVGRDFWAFRDLQQHGENSAYRDWFVGIDFSRRSPNGDAFAYDGWNGHYDLVKLNLSNGAVREHLFGAIRQWVDDYAIDGLRLDVASELDKDFLAALALFCHGLGDDFWLLGEAIHGDYRELVRTGTARFGDELRGVQRDVFEPQRRQLFSRSPMHSSDSGARAASTEVCPCTTSWITTTSSVWLRRCTMLRSCIRCTRCCSPCRGCRRSIMAASGA